MTVSDRILLVAFSSFSSGIIIVHFNYAATTGNYSSVLVLHVYVITLLRVSTTTVEGYIIGQEEIEC
jgi:hypothetical protein